jgi:U3 small nucleolar RNA-associated protein 11
MSSWKKFAPRKEHKERSQPLKRKRFGLLEKHKDYVIRARDYHRKEKTIKMLREKAFNRNPDEFYFAMNKSKLVDGVHRNVGSHATTIDKDAETMAHLKDQDRVYLRHKDQIEKSKIDRLQSSLHFLGDSSANKHTFYVDSRSDVEQFDLASHLHTAPELIDRTFNRPRVEQLAHAVIVGAKTEEEREEAERARMAKYTELAARLSREDRIQRMTNALENERLAQEKGHKVKVKGAKKTDAVLYKFRQERKR